MSSIHKISKHYVWHPQRLLLKLFIVKKVFHLSAEVSLKISWKNTEKITQVKIIQNMYCFNYWSAHQIVSRILFSEYTKKNSWNMEFVHYQGSSSIIFISGYDWTPRTLWVTNSLQFMIFVMIFSTEKNWGKKLF